MGTTSLGLQSWCLIQMAGYGIHGPIPAFVLGSDGAREQASRHIKAAASQQIRKPETTPSQSGEAAEVKTQPSAPAMATRAWAAATVALNPTLLTRRSCSRTLSVSPARRSAAPGLRLRSRRAKFECRRAKNAGYEDYKFPDPIPEFAEQETSKFREHMAWRLEQKKEDYFGEHVEEIVDICTEILGSFLENDYCGPGTLLVHPFLDMKGEIKERGLPGAPQAARAAIAWAEKNIDKDWKAWTGEY